MSCLIPREEQQVTDLQVNKTLNVDADKMDYLVINTSGEKSSQAIDERKIQTACIQVKLIVLRLETCLNEESAGKSLPLMVSQVFHRRESYGSHIP